MNDALRREQGRSVDPMCRVLGVSKTGHDTWKNRKPSARQQEDERLKVAIKDLWNKEIVGYAMSHRMTQDLVGRALFRAVAARRPPEGLVHHSDRGSQSCSCSYKKLMKKFKMKPSMSRKGNCWDNAPMESFFGTLKRALVHHQKYRTRQEAMAEVSEYIEMFYNRRRRYASLGNLSPAAYWRKFIRRQGAA